MSETVSILWHRLGFYDQNRDINPRNQRALTLLELLLECSLILFILSQKPNLEDSGLGFRVDDLGFRGFWFPTEPNPKNPFQVEHVGQKDRQNPACAIHTRVAEFHTPFLWILLCGRF